MRIASEESLLGKSTQKILKDINSQRYSLLGRLVFYFDVIIQ